jgi:hypothetical protein
LIWVSNTWKGWAPTIRCPRCRRRGLAHEERGRAVHAELEARGHVTVDVALELIAAVDALVELRRVEPRPLAISTYFSRLSVGGVDRDEVAHLPELA